MTLLNRLRGDRTVRDRNNCGQCMPACPNSGCGCNTGCSSCGDATGMSYGTVMEPTMAPVVAPAQAVPVVVPATEGNVIVPEGAKRVRPAVDPTAFVVRKN